MEPYPTEMRKRILADCDAGMGTQAVALKYLVSESWVRRLKQRRRENGEISARKLGSRRQPKWLPHVERIAEAVEEHPDATLAELREYLGLDIGVPTLARALQALRITFKKKCFTPKSRIARTLQSSYDPVLPVEDIFYDADFNCRGEFTILSVKDLADSIARAGGLICPVTVQPWTGHPGCKYRLVVGHRRYNRRREPGPLHAGCCRRHRCPAGDDRAEHDARSFAGGCVSASPSRLQVPARRPG
jgi:transposase